MTDEAAEGSHPPASRDPSAGARTVLSADASARDWTRTRTSDATSMPPAADEAAEEARVDVPPAGPPAPSAPAAARRPPLVVQGLLAALVGGVLAAAAVLGTLPLAAVVLALQVVLVLSVLALLDAPAARGAGVVALGATLVADALVLLDDGRVDRLTGAVGIGLVVALLHQLVRGERDRVTESLADTLLALLVAVAAACLVALHQLEGGEHVLLVGLAAAAAALLVGRLVDRVVSRPGLAAGSTRGWPGLLLALAAGAGVALLVAPLDSGAHGGLSAALLGLLAAATVATADLAVDLGATELRAGRRDVRRVSALPPTAVLLPYALLGPVVLLAGRLVLT